ncbi:MAG: acyl carrier protein [Anaerolineae bacterium]|nr:acyl carrier protein [Anaerolineae bacterium]
MSSQETFEKVQGIIAERLTIDAEKVTPEARLREDLGADSLDLVELIMDLEDAFDITISEEDGRALTSLTVGEAIEYLNSKIG